MGLPGVWVLELQRSGERVAPHDKVQLPPLAVGLSHSLAVVGKRLAPALPRLVQLHCPLRHRRQGCRLDCCRLRAGGQRPWGGRASERRAGGRQPPSRTAGGVIRQAGADQRGRPPCRIHLNHHAKSCQLLPAQPLAAPCTWMSAGTAHAAAQLPRWAAATSAHSSSRSPILCALGMSAGGDAAPHNAPASLSTALEVVARGLRFPPRRWRPQR